MAQKDRVELSDEGRAALVAITRQRRLDRKPLPSAGKGERARMLLKADQSPGGPAWSDRQLADAFDASVRSLERLRQWFIESGLDDTLRPPIQPPPPRGWRRYHDQPKAAA